MTRTLIIMGSARGEGHTGVAVERLRQALGNSNAALIDLRSHRIEPFSYERSEPSDDFLGIVDQLLRHQQVVFATPVYWYAMSGLMKILFDRLTDLLIDGESRNISHSLAGKDVWLLATGTDHALPTGFTEPFARTADYFGMRWRDAYYVRAKNGISPAELDLGEADNLAVALAS